MLDQEVLAAVEPVHILQIVIKYLQPIIQVAAVVAMEVVMPLPVLLGVVFGILQVPLVLADQVAVLLFFILVLVAMQRVYHEEVMAEVKLLVAELLDLLIYLAAFVLFGVF
jgi:hypothetical protein